MNIIKLLGVSVLILGLAACGDKSEEAATPAVEAASKPGNNVDRFNTEKFGSNSDPSTAPAPSFAISKNLNPGEYVNEKGEVVKNRELEGVVENPKLREIQIGRAHV